MLTNLTVPLAGLVDIALLGHLEDITPLAGVALAGLIFDYAYWSFGFLRMGTVGPAAKAFGAGDSMGLARSFWRPFMVAMLAGFALVALQTPLAWLGFTLLDGSPMVEAAGRDYYGARIWGAPATLGGYVITGWFLGHQRPRAALIYASVVNCTNVLLDYVFIYQFGWGAKGAGMATMIADYTAFIVGGWIIWRLLRGLPPISRELLLKGPGWGSFFALQAHILVRTFCLISTFATFTNLSAGFGAVVLAGNTLLLRLMSTAAYLIDGFSFALESLAGKYSGRRNLVAVQRALWQGLFWNGLTCGFFLLVFLIFDHTILGLLTDHGPVIEHAVHALPLVCVALLFGGVAYIFDGFFIGLAAGRLLSRNMVLAVLMGFVPFALLAWFKQNPDWLWYGMVAFMAMRMLTLSRYAFTPERRFFASDETYAVKPENNKS